MTERGVAHSDGAPACPFVAFEDDRDERSDRPDHRHRCYAEVHPAPRAIAHQEAYCLSSAFAVCPTFQDWAHREAARTRGAGAPVPPPGAAIAEEPQHRHDVAAGRPSDEDVSYPRSEPAAEWQGPRPAEQEDVPAPLPPRRNPPRDWAAPPPWASGPGGSGSAPAGNAADAAGAAAAGAAGGMAGSGAPPPQFLADRQARGLAGSSADRAASGESFVAGEPRDAAPYRDPWQPSKSPERAQPADAELGGLVGGGAAAASRAPEPPQHPSHPDDTGRYRSEDTRPPSSGGPNGGHEGPSWEQPRRYEAYPTIKARAALPGLPRLGIMAAALGIAALALFFLPSILDLFGGGGPGGTGSGGESPAPSAPLESVVPSPTVPPVPTPQVYVVKSGDTMSKIANKFNVPIDELIAANKDTIKDPDKISIGDQVIIPVPESEQEPGAFQSTAP